MIKKCELCGKEFESKGYSKYCSPECIYEGTWMKRRKVNEIKKICPECGKEFVAHRVDKIYCSSKCVQRHYQSKHKKAKMINKICPICGKKFRTKNTKIKYCSDECRDVVYNDYQAKMMDTIKRKRKKREENKKEKRIEKAICPECGNEFIKNRRFQVFCCEKCNHTYHNKQKSINSKRVCGICGKIFKPNNYYKYYCSDKCKIKASEIKEERNRIKTLERSRKKTAIEREKRLKLNERRKNGNEVLNEINRISKETGLSYGEVKKWYPDMDKIKFMANYLGRKGMDANEPRIVGRTSMLIV